MLAAGHILQTRYSIERVLGRGGMGAVYLATHLELGRSVAIKALSPPVDERAFPPSAIRQFRIEAQILHDLQHPCLPRVYDFLEEGGQPYLVMDYIPGRTLEDVVLTEGEVEEARVLGWARQLCDVLDFLHTSRPPVIFRDLKPSNIMLVDGSEQIKLIDFGIAKFYDAQTGAATQTTARGHISRGYAAPEQYGGGTDVRSDIYSLGATLYALLTLEIPPESVDIATGQAPAIDVRRHRSDVSVRTARAIESMTRVDRKRRPSSAREAATALGVGDDALGRTERGESTAKRAPSTRERPSSDLDRKPDASDIRAVRAQGRSIPPEPATGRWTSLESPGTGHPAASPPARDIFEATRPPGATGHATAPVSPAGRSGAGSGVIADHTAASKRVPPAARTQTPPLGRYGLALAVLGVVASLLGWLLSASPTPAPEPSTSAAAQQSASISVSTRPSGARVLVNGHERGRSPLHLSPIAAGTHEIRIEHDGYEPSTETVSLRRGEQSSVTLVLKPAPARLSVLVGPPGTSIYVDGVLKGTTLANAPTLLDLVPGPHTVWLTRRGCNDERREVRLVAGRTTEIRLELAAAATPRPQHAPTTAPAAASSPRPQAPSPSATTAASSPATVPPPPEESPTADPDGSDRRIVPGSRVWLIRLGASLDPLTRQSVRLEQMQIAGLSMLVFRKMGLAVAPENGRVSAIVVGSFGGQRPRARYATAGGVTLGSSSRDVIGEFGTDYVERPEGSGVRWSYPQGIAFHLVNGEVRAIAVFAAGAR